MCSVLRCGGLVVAACLLAVIAGSACEEPEHACDAFERFAEVMEGRCGPLTWDCQEHYPTLGPEAQQDLDWCMDCVLLEDAGEGEALCFRDAPWSGTPCGELLMDTLDATCFVHP